jgi:bifunctional enzyme CysN/CysC
MKQDASTVHVKLRAAARPADAAVHPPLRCLICGPDGDGKSTLTGRLASENTLLCGDAVLALSRDSRNRTAIAGEIERALLTGGRNGEREEGITAYRCFATAKRAFIIADLLEGDEDMRSMVVSALKADVAILVTDASRGLQGQTLQHAMIASLIGIRHVILAANKIDLVGFDQLAFNRIVEEFEKFATKLQFKSIAAIPISARAGDNFSSASARMPWYGGPPLVGLLEGIDIVDERSNKPFRMAVRQVDDAAAGWRGYGGTIASGCARPGDEVAVAGSGRISRVERIVTGDIDLAEALPGDTVTLVLTDDLGIAPGDLLAAPRHRPDVADQFAAHVVWLSRDRLLPGRSYHLKMGERTVPAAVTAIKHRLAPGTLDKLAAKTLSLNEVGFCNLATSAAVAFDSYADNRETGAFILLDRYSNEPVAAGMVAFALRRATNVHYQDITVSKQARAALKQQHPAIVWFTGLAGAGKSTVANLVEAQLHARGVHTVLLDGDNVRHGLNKDLGFTDADRVENIRRIGEVAKLMTEAGLIVLCAFISPFRAERRMVRDLVGEGEFIEVFVDTPLEECVARDPKGLYKRALAGQIKNFTGVDQPYERPEQPEIQLMAAKERPDVLAQRVVEELLRRKLF